VSDAKVVPFGKIGNWTNWARKLVGSDIDTFHMRTK
jgi:hypothetical protein